jgi:hypothetical protein
VSRCVQQQKADERRCENDGSAPHLSAPFRRLSGAYYAHGMKPPAAVMISRFRGNEPPILNFGCRCTNLS